jgi:hypothetical protein
MIRHEGDIYCEVHGTVHEPSTHPYDGCPTEIRDGVPVWIDPCTMEPSPPECEPQDWRKIWIGSYVDG